MNDLPLVHSWMTADPIFATPETKLCEAHKLMDEAHIRHLPILANNNLVSIVTKSDIRRAELETAVLYSTSEIKTLVIQLQPISEIMTVDPITIGPEATIAEAAQLMLTHKLTGLPVVRDHQLVGIITESDIFRLLVQTQAQNQIPRK